MMGVGLSLPEGPMMLTAIVMIDVVPELIPEVGQAVADVPGVSEVYSVTGDADLIAIVRVQQTDDLAVVIADRIAKVGGVTRTRTFIAFRTYSSKDMEAAFSIGLE